uniref:S100 calcium binding protein Z n=1 Tax=Seriola lalandi dorsalis TaxID=1841481 RepID=A0A3B4WSG1_SERLL
MSSQHHSALHRTQSTLNSNSNQTTTRVLLILHVSCILTYSQKDPMLVEKIMNDLDSNKDNEVDFNEFVVLVAALTVACNDFFQEQKKKIQPGAVKQ